MHSCRRSIGRVALASAVVVVALVGVQIASASTKPLKGTIILTTNTVIFTHNIGTATEVFANAHVTYAGDMTGHASETYVTLTEANGHAIQYGYGEFEGSIDGQRGTATYSINGPNTSGGAVKFISGTGGLADLHGGFTYKLIDQGPMFTYEGSLR